VLFVFFTAMSLLRLILYPKVAINIIHDFTQTSFLGAIPIALDTIILGIAIFYSQHSAAVWTALGFFWASVFLTLVGVFGSVFVVYSRQGEVELSDVTGV
jgi:tellurite resistance protein TehA-like permease